MSAPDGSSQLRINPDTGEIEAQPLTWDGEPVYHPESMVELFNADAFEQIRGQLTVEDTDGR